LICAYLGYKIFKSSKKVVVVAGPHSSEMLSDHAL